jgi:hypothetical protein
MRYNVENVHEGDHIMSKKQQNERKALTILGIVSTSVSGAALLASAVGLASGILTIIQGQRK